MVGNNTASVGLKVQNPDTALRSARVQLAVCETAAGWWQSVSGAGTNESDCLGLSKSSSDGRAPSPRCPSHVLPHGQDKHLDFGHRTWTSKKKKKSQLLYLFLKSSGEILCQGRCLEGEQNLPPSSLQHTVTDTLTRRARAAVPRVSAVGTSVGEAGRTSPHILDGSWVVT